MNRGNARVEAAGVSKEATKRELGDIGIVEES
jgi:hypothetical protein